MRNPLEQEITRRFLHTVLLIIGHKLKGEVNFWSLKFQKERENVRMGAASKLFHTTLLVLFEKCCTPPSPVLCVTFL